MMRVMASGAEWLASNDWRVVASTDWQHCETRECGNKVNKVLVNECYYEFKLIAERERVRHSCLRRNESECGARVE